MAIIKFTWNSGRKARVVFMSQSWRKQKAIFFFPLLLSFASFPLAGERASQVAWWGRICLPTQETLVWSLGGKIPWRRARHPTPVFLPGESHGQRSLMGYSPWGHKVRHDWVTEYTLSSHTFSDRTPLHAEKLLRSAKSLCLLQRNENESIICEWLLENLLIHL